MSSSGWEDFWKDQRQSFLTVMEIATTFFALQIENLFHLKLDDEILDYGCGPGFLADHLATQKISITGLDINQFYIEQCQKNHPESLFISITTDTEKNKKILEVYLNGKKFDFIILLSIV